MRPSAATATTLLLAAFFVVALSAAIPATVPAVGASPEYYSDEQQPLVPGNFTAATTLPNTVPAFPVAQASNQSAACHLDLSNELFGGVSDACGRAGGLDRSRCCPVLAAWLFAAHARSALEIRDSSAAAADDLDDGRPMMPDDNQKCVDSLQVALERRSIRLPRPNATCDLVLCFCGIRLHEIGSLRCPAAFNLSAAALGGANATAVPRNATPTEAVRKLEHECRNASYAGCSRCLHSLEKLKTHNGVPRGGAGSGSTGGDRPAKMFNRDCQMMGLTWLLARNKTAYIPTVSAVLRAILYSTYPATGEGSNSYRCSPDQENMPLAVDSLQFQHLGGQESSAHRFIAGNVLLWSFVLSVLNLLLPCAPWDL